AIVIGCHGLYATGDSPKQLALAEKCVKSNIAYFRFDHTGCGKSQGTLKLSSCLKDRSNDLMGAVNAMKKERGDDVRIALFGSSMGGTVCLNTAKEIEPICMVTFAAPVVSRTLTTDHGDAQNNALSFDITRRLDSIKNILIFHGDADDVVPIENSKLIFNRAQNPKKKIFQNGGDHRMSDPGHQDDFIFETVNWYRLFFKTKKAGQ
ncbi:MAG: alpha/beta hydrolase, partial [Desulfobacteraceae bacterium]|nr:alpha/beta hydrolase [Desulfobacteraceae bacterium]